MGWQWRQLNHMPIICTSLQTDNHASTSPLSFLHARCPSCCPTNSIKAWCAWYVYVSSCCCSVNCFCLYINLVVSCYVLDSNCHKRDVVNEAAPLTSEVHWWVKKAWGLWVTFPGLGLCFEIVGWVTVISIRPIAHSATCPQGLCSGTSRGGNQVATGSGSLGKVEWLLKCWWW